MDAKLCDLHVHSTFSDGSNTPEELIAIAEKYDLSALALCDHNTVAGLPRFLKAAASTSVIPVPGVEVSCGFRGKEVHMLGLFLPQKAFRDVAQYLLEINIRKVESNELLIENLNRGGYDIDYPSVQRVSEGDIPNRVHFANVLMEKGYVKSVDEAFQTILSAKGPFYKPSEKLDAFEVISFLSSVGAVPVMAHPFLNLQGDALLEFLTKGKQCGLVGMECLYSLFSDAQTKEAYGLAAQFGLLPSGGSDYHGTNKPTIQMGVGHGNLAIPFSFCEGLNPN